MTKVRLDRLLVERGFFDEPKKAAPWILAGKVIVNGDRIDKPGAQVLTSNVRIKGLDNPYVSLGGLKLAHALKEFDVNPAGVTALDAGAAAGGFTDCLLQHGAAKVYAVECGHDQLDWKLRSDPRVVNMERVNVGSLTPQDFEDPPCLATLDLGYLALTKGIPQVSRLLALDSEMICLIKPRFELGSNALSLELDHKRAISQVCRTAEDDGWRISGLCLSPILGSRGDAEFLLHISREGKGGRMCDWTKIVDNIIMDARELLSRQGRNKPMQV